MNQLVFGKDCAGIAPENYQRYFVPSTGHPMAEDLIVAAKIKPGERVLDVACGTGVVTCMAAEIAGPDSAVAAIASAALAPHTMQTPKPDS